MRLNRLLPVLFVPAVACGGGGNTTPMPVDTPAPQDTPDTPAVCPVATEMGGLVLAAGVGQDNMAGTADDVPIPGNSCGANQMTPCDWFETPMTGPNANKRTLFIIARLPAEIDTDTTNADPNVLAIELVSDNGVFITGTPKAFSTDPAVVGSVIGFGSMDGVNYDAAAYIIGNLSSGGMLTHLYSASSGTIELSQVGDTANSTIRGQITATNFREVDGAADVPGGCTGNLTDGMAFSFIQGMDAAKRTPTAAEGGVDQQTALRAVEAIRAHKAKLAQAK